MAIFHFMKKHFLLIFAGSFLLFLLLFLTACGRQSKEQFQTVPYFAETQDKKSVSTQNIIQKSEKPDIRIISPDLNKPIKSPLKIAGQASGLFFDEGVFSIILKDVNGQEIGRASSRAMADWMTSELVPFEAELVFQKAKTATGKLVFEPGTGPGNAPKSQEFPVIFEETDSKEKAGMSSSKEQSKLQEAEDPIDKKSLARLRQGCLSGKDCIPSIDHPKFLPAKKAAFMKDEDMILGFVSGREARAYPIKILNWHEIVNDSFQNKPIVVTFCPLCMTGRVFDRVVDSETLEFGVSGMLLNSNLVMYDRKTNSLWSQFAGEALIGPKRGTKLKQIQTDTVLWKDWVKQHPSTLVLSNSTGFERDYEKYPYSDYRESGEVYFPLEHEDKSRFAKEIVYGIVLGDKQKMYSETELKKALPAGGSFEDSFSGEKLKVAYDKGVLRIKNVKTNEEILNAVSFYFSWYAFYPKAEIFKAPKAK